MSRTKRANRTGYSNLVSYIKAQRSLQRMFHVIWVQRSPEEIQAEKDAGKTYVPSYRAILGEPFIYDPKSDIEWWQKEGRDGLYGKYRGKRAYRKAAAHKIRRDNRRVCQAILRGKYDPEDDYELPSRQHGKALLWDYF